MTPDRRLVDAVARSRWALECLGGLPIAHLVCWHCGWWVTGQTLGVGQWWRCPYCHQPGPVQPTPWRAN